MEPSLYIVATPIGTMGDLSPRAREVLENVAFIACEDTRHSGRLLAHFHIRTPLESLHQHNERARTDALLETLKSSPQRAAAIITDAGTPCISDPGSWFVRRAREGGVRILSVPGPSALTTALAACGYLQPRTVFSGFLGRSRRERQEEFARWSKVAPCIAVFYESPHRVRESLMHLEESFGPAVPATVSRELSKRFEEHLGGTVAAVRERLAEREELQGEFVVCVDVGDPSTWTGLLSQAPSDDLGERVPALDLDSAARHALEWLDSPAGRASGASKKESAKKFAKEFHLNAKELYNKIQETNL